jgi:P-type conjugative transfer protein TrbJ
LLALAQATPGQALIVYDPTNYVQNALQAARALQQINQQIQALQNQATMITTMMRNLDHLDISSLSSITAQLTSLQQLIGRGQGLSAQAASIDQRIAALFPKTGPVSVASGATQAQQRLVTQMAGFEDSLRAEAHILAEVGHDQATLSSVTSASERASGNLAVTQATNQLLALAAKQQAQLQTMLAVHFQADALADTDRLQQRSDAQAEMRRFLGTGQVYTPQ